MGNKETTNSSYSISDKSSEDENAGIAINSTDNQPQKTTEPYLKVILANDEKPYFSK